MMTNREHNVIQTGVTNDLERRVYEHKHKVTRGFVERCNITKPVYFESYQNAYDAISREKQIKGGSRQKKISLIESMNPK